jgi:polar amino acid transport system ATP-binding protein
MNGNSVIIKTEGLKKHYNGDSIQALDGIDLEIYRGEVVVIIGPSGSGKSTLLRSLNLLELPTGGSIFFNGEDINAPKVNINKHRQKMGMVFQHFNLFNNMTILKNMTIAPVKLLKKSKEEAEQKATLLLERVGLAARAGAYPSQLSGGQKQRIAIVRALCMEPEVMLFDEPTSALDPEMVGEVLDVMKELAADGMTVLLTSHQLFDVQDICSTVAVVSEGRKVGGGALCDIVANAKDKRHALEEYFEQRLSLRKEGE